MEHLNRMRTGGSRPVARGPMSPEAEDRRRRMSTIILGSVLLLSFLLPVPLPGEPGEAPRLHPVSFLLLFGSNVPFILRLFAILPAAAGLIVILLGIYAKVEARARGMVMLGLLAVALAFALMSVTRVTDLLGALLGPGVLLVTITAGLATMCIFVGSRSRWYRPSSSMAAKMAWFGGGLYLVSLVIPGLPIDLGLVPIWSPFRMMVDEKLAGTGIAALVQLLFGLGAAGLCLANNQEREAKQASGMAWGAFALVTTAVVLGPVTLMAIFDLDRPAWSGGLLSWTTLKLGTWIGGLMLLLPFGLIEGIVGEPAEAISPRVGLKPPAGPPRRRTW